MKTVFLNVRKQLLSIMIKPIPQKVKDADK